MKKIYALLLISLFFIKASAQIAGLSYYTSTLTPPANNNAYPTMVAQAPNGDIWASTNSGLVKFSNGVFSGPFTPSGVGLFTTLCPLNNGIWCRRQNGNVYFFDGTTWNDHTVNFTNSNQKNVAHIAQVGTEVWFATREGIKVYNGSTWSTINKSSNGLPCDSVTYIKPVNATQILIGTMKGLVMKNNAVYTSYNFPAPASSFETSQVYSIFTDGARHFVTRVNSYPKLMLYEFNGSAIVSAKPVTKGADVQTSYNIGTMLYYNGGILLPYQSSFQGETGFYNCFYNTNNTKYYLFPPTPAGNNYVTHYFKAINPNKVWFVTTGSSTFKVGELDLPTFSYFYDAITYEETKYLDINNVKASISSINNKHWDISGTANASYEVPKGSGVNASFATSIWIGGLDASNQLHVAANTYRQGGKDFWPGPLDPNTALTNTNTAMKFKKVWKTECNEINNFVSGCVMNSNTLAPTDIKDYPANDVSVPYYDANNDNFYNAADCDYPIIKGDQQILSVFNDNFSAHTETGGSSMGLEIIERSYAYNNPTVPDSMKAINYTTFYHYTIINRSNTNYHDVYISDWTDADLGCYMDDYIGADSLNQFAYMYNKNNTDPNCAGAMGYGTKPPVLSHVMLKTPCTTDGIDNDHDGFIDEVGEQFLMDKVTYYNNNIGSFPAQTTNPSTPGHFYNYMNGRWKDSSFVTYGGNGYGGSSPTPYVYSGNPETGFGWTETTANNNAGDRRFLMSSGPFNFPSKSKIEWEFAIVYSRDTTAANTIQKFNATVRRDVRNVKYYHQTHQNPQCTPYTNIGIKEISKPFNAFVYPNPATEQITVNINKNASKLSAEVLDMTGRVIRSVTAADSYAASINIADLSSGVYLIRVSDGQSRVTEKWVKQ